MKRDHITAWGVGLYIWITWVCLLGQPEISFAQNQTNIYCTVCGKLVQQGTVWRHARGLVCDECYQLESRCSLCGLPVKEGFAKTSDGRLLCSWDATNAVLTVESARELFETTRNSLRELFQGQLELKQPQVDVTLYGVDYWNYDGGKLLPTAMRRTGISQSRQLGNSMVHSILLWSGQLKTDLMAVCAHEYTHLWINEHKALTRKLDTDTVEAICELVAYKLMLAKKEPSQVEKILSNGYTHGKINELVELESRHTIGPILDWVKNGTGATLESTTLLPIVPASRPLLMATSAPVDSVPNTLKLQGLFVGQKQRRALINGCSFGKSEERTVRVGTNTVVVRCLDLLDDAAVIRVNGSTQPQTLYLDGK